MLSQLIGKLNTREVMQDIVARFYPHPQNRLEDTFLRSQTIVIGTTYSTVVKHSKSGTFLIIEKTESGIIRVASDAGDNHSEMFKIGLAQLESEMPVVVVKKTRKPRKTKANVIAEMAAKTSEAVAEIQPTSKPRKRKPKATQQ